MRLRWTPIAAEDLEDIYRYLLANRPALVRRTVREIYHAIQSLRRLPQRGRLGVREGTRELVLSPLPYIVVYRVQTGTDTVEVLHIDHGAQDRLAR